MAALQYLEAELRRDSQGEDQPPCVDFASVSSATCHRTISAPERTPRAGANPPLPQDEAEAAPADVDFDECVVPLLPPGSCPASRVVLCASEGGEAAGSTWLSGRDNKPHETSSSASFRMRVVMTQTAPTSASAQFSASTCLLSQQSSKINLHRTQMAIMIDTPSCR